MNIPKRILREALVAIAIESKDKKLIKQLRHSQRVYREQRTRINERRAFATIKSQPSWRMNHVSDPVSVTWCENINPKAGGSLNATHGDEPFRGTPPPKTTKGSMYSGPSNTI
jgi:hypothetical protein